MTDHALHWLGDDALLLRWPAGAPDLTLRAVHTAAAWLEQHATAWLRDLTPAYQSLALHLQPPFVPPEVEALARSALQVAERPDTTLRRHWLVPVVYGGPELEQVANALGLLPAEVIARHTAQPLTVAMLGFLPGFAYLAGLDPQLALPRRSQPRPVRAGSVLMAAGQTAVLPQDAPSGWHVLGWTGVRLWADHAQPPCLLQPLDTVQFVAVDSPAQAQTLRPASGQRLAWPPPAWPLLPAPDTGLRVDDPGPLLVVQGGLRRARRYAVGEGGPHDPALLALANGLLGQPTDTPGLEWHWHGPRLVVASTPLQVAWAGDAPVWVDHEPQPPCCSTRLLPGQTLQVGQARRMRLGYVAIGGGVQTQGWLGSPSCQTSARGGPRPLQAGQLVAAASVPDQPDRQLPLKAVHQALLPDDADSPVVLRALPGPELTDWLTADPDHQRQWSAWLAQPFVVGDGDRMALRLRPPAETPQLQLPGMVSGPVGPGVVQLPPGGQPLVLGPDAQTTGGYPRVLRVIAADRPRLARLRPGQTVVLQSVGLAHALQAAREAQHSVARILQASQARARRHSGWLLGQGRLEG